MERMWSPWRSQYIATFKKKPAKKKRSRVSLFAAALKAKDDDRHLIVWRGKRCFVIMNRYPYNSGHLMVVPNRQTADVQSLTGEELAEIMQTVQRSIRALDDVMHPQGYNFGTNIGRVSGAGVADHIHFHVVPRWNGDTNFMPVLADTKVISEDMRDTLTKLRKSFAKTARGG
ncbi:ATP adenylyltransferase [Gammaproteobacteria bacterium]|nr:ATP adenylyltransferase [Gammaproteobacteria bacterium]